MVPSDVAFEIAKLQTEDLTAKGPWWHPAVFVGVRTATLRCPECGETLWLNRHTIDEDGTVTPSVKCSTDGCGFRQTVVLKDWDK